jgi:hypothetical protein
MVKINLIWSNTDLYGEDFINIGAFVDEESANIRRGDVKNLDKFLDNGEAETIVAADIIDYLDSNKVGAVIQHWVSKLAHGGTITIGGVDLLEVSRAIFHAKLSITQANELIHGSPAAPYLLKRTTYSMLGVVHDLESFGLRVIKKRVDGYLYLVEAQRP